MATEFKMPDAELCEQLSTNHILVADDDPIYRTMIASWLNKWGYKVEQCENGRRAWEVLQQPNAPSLIVMDWMMPEMDGVEVCRRLRAFRPDTHPYVILLTANSTKEQLIHGLHAGADEYLTKPFHMQELQARLLVGTRILNLQNALMRQEQQLRFAAAHDYLTGLWNRGAMMGFMSHELDRSARSAKPLSIAMLDIDYFKRINDTYGHQVGDVVLKEVAHRLQNSTRSYDWLGRYGGEEFMVTLSNCEIDELRTAAERFRLAVCEHPINTEAGPLSVTVSVGGAALPSGVLSTCDGLVQIADRELYRAKANGRNRVEIARTAITTATSVVATDVAGSPMFLT